MKRYIVDYIASGNTSIEYFHCEADDTSHALDQCEDAWPEAEILNVFVLREETIPLDMSGNRCYCIRCRHGI